MDSDRDLALSGPSDRRVEEDSTGLVVEGDTARTRGRLELRGEHHAAEDMMVVAASDRDTDMAHAVVDTVPVGRKADRDALHCS